jgi:hypothetical protein
MKKQLAEPILTLFPSEGTFRDGRSRQISIPEYNDPKRVLYYSVLPDVPYHSSQAPYNPYSEFIRLPTPPRSNQRSYNAHNAGKEFVTRVQSAIINVNGEDKNKDSQKSNPSYTIIDAPPAHHQYPINSVNKVMQPAGYYNKHMTGIEYHHSPYYNYHQKPYISDFKLPYSSSLPYYNTGNGIGLSQYQHYQHQSSPYYDEVEKVHASGHEHLHHQHHHTQHLTGTVPHQSPPFPTRHLRFPPSRYPLGSPFSDLLSSSRPLNSHPLDSSFPEHSSSTGFGDGFSSSPFSFDFNDNLGPVTMDHNLDYNNNNKFSNKPLTLRDKFPTFNKYSDASDSFNSPFFNSQFSPASDTLMGNKPFDQDAFNWAAAAMQNVVTGEKGFHVKGSSASGEAQTQNTTESEKITTTPSTLSLSEANTDETQTDIPLESK